MAEFVILVAAAVEAILMEVAAAVLEEAVERADRGVNLLLRLEAGAAEADCEYKIFFF